MKIWLGLFLGLLIVGIAFGLARDLLSRERGVLSGVVIGVDLGNPTPKWLPATPPRFKVQLADGRVIEAATRTPHSIQIGSAISLTEWVTPWGQVWYTQRD